MKDICIASLVSLTLALATAPSDTLAQAPTAAEDGPRPVRLELDASAVGERALGLGDLLHDELASVFEANGAELVDMSRSDAPQLRVRIGGKFKDIELFDYELHFELVEGDKVTKLIEPVACDECYDPELVVAVARQVSRLLEEVEARRAAAAAAAAETDTGDGDAGDGDSGDGDTGDGDTGDGDTTEPVPKPIGVLGGVGIGVATLGLGAVVWGSVELSRGRVHEVTAHTDPYRTWTDHKPRGTALLGAGIGSLALGTALVVTDVVLRAKRRKQVRSESGMILPITSPDGFGLVWVQRF